MKSRLIALFALLMLVAVSCKEDSTSPDDNNTLPGVYYPIKIGYWWKYAVTGMGMPSQITYTVSRDSLINGKKWFILTNDAVVGFVLHRYEGTVLMMRTMVSTNELEYKLFDENGKTGDSIITTFETNNIPFMVVSKILQKGANKTVQGKEYKDVMELQIDIYTDVMKTGWKLFMSEQDYFAKNVGPIKVYAEDFCDRELLEYSVK